MYSAVTIWLLTIIVFMAIYLILKKYFSRKYNYWKNKNVKYLEPPAFFGHFKDIVTMKISLTDWHRKMYKALDEPYFGIYLFDEPFLIIRSPELVKQICINDFQHFADRGIIVPDHDIITANLTFWKKDADGWKNSRSIMSPMFSSNKLKSVFPALANISKEMTSFIREKYCNGISVEAKALCGRYTTDTISKFAFNVDALSFKFEKPKIWEIASSMFEFTLRNGISQISFFYFPTLVKLFRMSFYGERNIKFLRDAVNLVMEDRAKLAEPSLFGDVVDAIIKAQHNNVTEVEGEKRFAIPIEMFIAGYETTSTTMGFALYQLAQNKDIQNKLRSEIINTVTECGGITYDGIQKMAYLEQCIKETLRMYPPVPFLDRKCIMDYKLPGTDLTIEKGVSVQIPMLGLHYDEKYFPEPGKFNPERFDDMNQINDNGLFYMPFGDGPRTCVGKRFALLGSKVALVHILLEFEVERIDGSPPSIEEFEKKSFVLQAKDGLPITFRPLT